MRVAKAGISPGFTGVGRFVNTVASVEIVADVRLAGAGIDDVRIRIRYRERTDRTGHAGERRVGDIRPVLTVIVALPNSALNAAHIKQVRLARDTSDSHDATADIWSDASPGQFADDLLLRRLSGRASGKGNRTDAQHECERSEERSGHDYTPKIESLMNGHDKTNGCRLDVELIGWKI